MNTIVSTIRNGMSQITYQNHSLYVFDSALADFVTKIGLRFFVGEGVGIAVTSGGSIGAGMLPGAGGAFTVYVGLEVGSCVLVGGTFTVFVGLEVGSGVLVGGAFTVFVGLRVGSGVVVVVDGLGDAPSTLGVGSDVFFVVFDGLGVGFSVVGKGSLLKLGW